MSAPFGIIAGDDGTPMRVDDRPYDRQTDPEAVRIRRNEGSFIKRHAP
jgi:hypothetical protein